MDFFNPKIRVIAKDMFCCKEVYNKQSIVINSNTPKIVFRNDKPKFKVH